MLGIVKKFEPQNTSPTFFLKCIQEYIEIRIASFIHEHSKNHRDEIDHIDKIIPILSANDLEGENGASYYALFIQRLEYAFAALGAYAVQLGINCVTR